MCKVGLPDTPQQLGLPPTGGPAPSTTAVPAQEKKVEATKVLMRTHALVFLTQPLL